MRARSVLPLPLLLVVVPTAAANPKAVEAVVRKNIVELANLADNDVLGYGERAQVIDHMGSSVDMDSEEACLSGAVANAFYGCLQASVTHQPAKIIVGLDGERGVAWFQAPYTAIVTSDVEDDAKPTKTAMRTGGIAIKHGKRWQIVAQMYSLLVSDKELLAGTDGKPATGAPTLRGDTKLAGVVAGWFASGFAPNVATTGTVVASGTSRSELKTGPGARKLAASFDELKIDATTVDAKLYAGGAIGWVIADVKMPRKSGKGAVEMKLAVVVVTEGKSWRWVSLQYQFPYNPVAR